MRRIILDEPMSRTAASSRSFAVFAFIVASIGVVMAREGLDPSAAVAVEVAAMIVAGLAIPLAFAGMVAVWRTGCRGTGRLLAGLALAALVLAYPAYLAIVSRGVPVLADVSTDWGDPPVFSTAAAALAARGGVTPDLPPADRQETQRKVYPGIQPVLLDMEAMDAFRLIAKLVAARRWTIVDETLPLGASGVGRIDAVATSAVMGFPADVTIRIKPTGGQSRVDMRSVSRGRWHQPGANVARIQALTADIEDQADEK